MKTITVLIFLVGCSVLASGQNMVKNKSFYSEKFRQEQSLFDSLGLGISPEMKNGLPDDHTLSLLDKRHFKRRNKKAISFDDFNKSILRMPIVGSALHSKMPVLVSDSTVTYFIREKRFNMINPLDKSPRIQKDGKF